MKKTISAILTFVLIVQIVTPSFAQSSIQNQMARLQQCVNERFDMISEKLTEIEGSPVQVDESVRLVYSKYILEQILISMDSEISHGFSEAKYWGSFAIVGSIGAILSEKRTKIAKAKFTALEQEYAISQLNGKEIRGGRTAVIASEVKFWKSAIPITRYLTSGLFLFTFVTGWMALKNLAEVVPQKMGLHFAGESLFRLKYAVSEYDFYRALREETPIMEDIRQRSLMVCRSTTSDQIVDVINSLLVSTKEDRANAFAQIQKDMKSEPQD